jgi:BON domain-containing protein
LPSRRNNRPFRTFKSAQRPEDPMNNRDETIREKLLDRLTTLGVDARNLAVEVEHGMVIARGSVPNEEQRQRAIDALIGAHELQITIRPVAPGDADDGRGRSPVTGTSAESAHQSRRQTDPT